MLPAVLCFGLLRLTFEEKQMVSVAERLKQPSDFASPRFLQERLCDAYGPASEPNPFKWRYASFLVVCSGS